MALQTRQRKRSNPGAAAAMKQALQEKMCRLNTEFSESEYRQMKACAAQEGKSLAEITRQLWREHLNK
jgi:hypothetical protein